MAKRNSHFQRGSGVYKCCDCGRSTRNTGVQSRDSECCAECYELCGYENMLSDNGELSIEDRAVCRGYRDMAIAKGGNAARINKQYGPLF